MISTSRFHPGQRWISVSEPELGLGEVRRLGPRTVTVWFPATQQSREYVADEAAPIRRAVFRAGDTIASRTHGPARIESVSERDGLLYYACGTFETCETDLSHELSFNSPLERLFAGQFDPSHHFDLRLAALEHQHRRRRSRVRGFVGGRIDLLPHQLGIAAEVTGRLAPRVLLADEVGLGKTIEACLIVHRLLLTGRAQRVLVVVPESLVHQWFLELFRRFNLWFHIFNEGRCVAIEEADARANPFSDDQLVLCDLGLFLDNPERLEQALAAGWDMVIVDEAHHLEWSPAASSPAYRAVEKLAAVSPGLLLLTATPEQLGVAGHFARLRLLDPDRFFDLDTFLRESDDYRTVAQLVDALAGGRTLSDSERHQLARTLGYGSAQDVEPTDPDARAEIVARLLDQHGTGRVMFRNTRSSIGGFPKRVAHLHSLVSSGTASLKSLTAEWATDAESAAPSSRVTLAQDVRIQWVLGLLQSLAPQKILLICHTPERAMAIEAVVRQRTTLPLGTFHEGQTLIQRDRSAAWFADPDGARLLICSEIGSEGRNFQFAQHLVLFDLPLDPGLVEQRIGRLDRIGQRGTIHIHVPVVKGSYLDVLARWYHDGISAIEEDTPGSRQLLERFEPELRRLVGQPLRAERARQEALDEFIGRARDAREQVRVQFETGRDRLLERLSAQPARSESLVAEIRAHDGDRTLDEFMLEVFDLFFIDVEEIAPRTYRLGSAGVLTDEFPGLSADGLTVTCDRARALLREDLQFLTWDHPLTSGALDMLLASEKGNCSIARWHDAATALYADVTYVLESLAPASLHVDRFLPPTPVRVIVDHKGLDASSLAAPMQLVAGPVAAGTLLLARYDVRDRLLPRMLERAGELAESRRPAIVDAALQLMHGTLDHEVTRLRELQRVNPLIRDEEIAALVGQRGALDEHIRTARIRLDCVRVVHRGPER